MSEAKDDYALKEGVNVHVSFEKRLRWYLSVKYVKNGSTIAASHKFYNDTEGLENELYPLIDDVADKAATAIRLKYMAEKRFEDQISEKFSVPFHNTNEE